MPVKLKVYTNEDDALLFWSIPQPIPECRGFAIQRRIKRKDESNTQEDFLPNRVDFESANADNKLGTPVEKSSVELPFQRFSWTDHDAETDDEVSYRIIPVVRNSDSILELLENESSGWSAKRKLTSGKGKFKPFFNRGFVISQFMSRFLSKNNLTLKEFKNRISDKDDKTIREFLSGDLRKALLLQLETAFNEKGEIFAALFELSDNALIEALCKLKGKANIVLSNGSVTKRKDETTAKARLRDENEKARATLLANGVNVETPDRFLSPGALGHNKFLVRTNKNGDPVVAWTGSTNWAPTGLCTQVNNGLLIEDTDVAKIYLQQWHDLKDAKSEFPAPFVEANSQPRQVGDDVAGQLRSTVWFTRTHKSVDLNALRQEVANAKQGILFLMFMPGSTGVFSTVAARSAEPGLYVRGVASELPNGRGDESAVDVNLIDGANHNSFHLDIIQPEGNEHPFANFAEEVTRKQFLSQVGHAIVHSKILVIDPFSDNPVVVAGSHNFSTTASTKNDENFIIIKGDAALAEAYAVNIMGVYNHYRWRAFLSQSTKPFNGLKDKDTWQAPMLKANEKNFEFWGVI